MRPSLLLVSLFVVAQAAAAAPAPAAPAATTPPPPRDSCWSITGPFTERGETYFKASNRCDTPRHCQVWVNGTEPPITIHLDTGTSGRIDVGKVLPGDTYSTDCAPIGVHGEHYD